MVLKIRQFFKDFEVNADALFCQEASALRIGPNPIDCSR
jgi:hypothetical protein